MKVEDDGRAFVVKRALAKLRVKDDWFADVQRNRYEHLYMERVAAFLPDAIPRVIHVNDDKGFFCMEWLGEGWANWKQNLLEGRCRVEEAREAGRILGVIHRQTSGDESARRSFDNTDQFFQLRLEPYLLTTGRRHPDLLAQFEAEAARIAATRECLVHGDFSPKNILVRDGRMIVLDCEVAWYGDPVFDLAFLLNHLHLKALHHAPAATDFEIMIASCRDAYFAERNLGPAQPAEMSRLAGRLLVMLMLARVDGKSPAEYLADQPKKQDFIRAFAIENLAEPIGPGLEHVTTHWFSGLERIFPHQSPN